jgi:alpha-L-fucosidase
MLLALAACMTIAMPIPQLPIKTTESYKAETPEQKDARMGWWREARFGMFIHWGLYSIPAGEWMGKDGYGEWIRDSARIPIDAYNGFLPRFDPYKFDAKKWVQIAKDAGMKYIVITTKHHDGFALFDSKVSEWDIMSSPFKRDVLKELAAECDKQGIVLCFYHSIMDWHHPDYLPRRAWEADNRPAGNADMDQYVRYLHSQVTELLTNYGPIGIVWFDGEWESTWNHAYGQALYNLCRTLQPNTIVNNRVDNGRGGSMSGMSGEGFAGDYGTPEQEIPVTGKPGVDWETCMTMNAHWGYNRNDKQYKSTRDLLRNLVDIASKGGNYLLNVGPDSLGEIPGESVARLREIGDWMDVYGDSIYGTSASIFSNLPWGRCTVRKTPSKMTVYLHVFDWPTDGRLVVSGLGDAPTNAAVLGGDVLPAKREGPNLVLQVPRIAPDKNVTVLALEFAEFPTVYDTPTFDDTPGLFVNPPRIGMRANRGLEIRYTVDGRQPDAQSAIAQENVASTFWHIDLPDADRVVVTIQGFHKGVAVTDVAAKTFTRVTPFKALTVPDGLGYGLAAMVYEGSWDKLPAFKELTATGAAIVSSVSDTPWIGRENVGVVLEGYIHIPGDELYIFELTSDDGSRLLIDGQIVADNDGLHSTESKTGAIALAEGYHSIRVEWFNKTGAVALRLRIATPGQEFKDVPARWLVRRP